MDTYEVTPTRPDKVPPQTSGDEVRVQGEPNTVDETVAQRGANTLVGNDNGL